MSDNMLDDTILDNHIMDLFNARWCGDRVLSRLDNMKAQLNETLQDQMDGYWSGHTAYHLAVDGGFLIDAKATNGLKKELTPLGVRFMQRQNERKGV